MLLKVSAALSCCQIHSQRRLYESYGKSMPTVPARLSIRLSALSAARRQSSAKRDSKYKNAKSADTCMGCRHSS